MVNKCKVCGTTKGVKNYGSFCGIKLDYCKEHNYLFRELSELNRMAEGHEQKLKEVYKRLKQRQLQRDKKKWEQFPII